MTEELERAIAEIRQEFCAGLPERMEGLGAALAELSGGFEPTAAEKLWRQAHSLAGTAGSFGLPDLADPAQELSALGRSWLERGTVPPDDLSAARSILNTLETRCHARLVGGENQEDL